jgi:hypothetical protein
MPELERRARGGDVKATRLLVRRLQGCKDYRPVDETEERQRIDEDYQRQLEIQAQYPKANPTFVIDETWHAARIREMSDKRDLCGTLSSRKIASRFDWAALAVSRGDRETILMLPYGGLFGPSNMERLRHVDALIALSTDELGALQSLAEGGDVKALGALAMLHGHPDFSIFEGGGDPMKAYAFAYALSLTGDHDEAWRADEVFREVGRALTPEQLDAAAQRGPGALRSLLQRPRRPGGALTVPHGTAENRSRLAWLRPDRPATIGDFARLRTQGSCPRPRSTRPISTTCARSSPTRSAWCRTPSRASPTSACCRSSAIASTGACFRRS